MSKILFVDDEITKNVDVLKQLFRSVISQEECDNLTQLKNSPLGVDIARVKEVLKDNPVLEVENSFARAISRIKAAEDGRNYDLFLLDRNLAGNRMYRLEEIAKIMPGYDENALELYKEREGDFLLLLLHLQGVPCREKVYFYSAYQKDAIRSALYLQHMIGIESFGAQNFVDKSDLEAKKKFRKEVIENLEDARIVARYHKAFSGLRKAYMSEADKKFLIDILRDKSKPSDTPRPLLEHFLAALKNYPGDYTWRKLKSGLDFAALRYANPQTNAHLASTPDGPQPGPQKVPEFVYLHCESIRKYCNKYLSHNNDDEPGLPTPTDYSWPAVKYMLVEVFNWLDNELQ